MICKRNSWRSISRVTSPACVTSARPMTGPHSWIAVAASVRTCDWAAATAALSPSSAASVVCTWTRLPKFFAYKACARSIGRQRRRKLRLRGLELRVRRHVVGVERGQAREIEHRSEGADLILIGRPLRHHRLKTDRVLCRLVDRDDGLAARGKRHAQGRLDGLPALGLDGRLFAPLHEPRNHQGSQAAANGRNHRPAEQSAVQ